MTLRVIEKINESLKFLWRKHGFLTPALRRLLCNALIQPHFDYASTPGTLIYKIKFQTNFRFVRTSALDSACHWETVPTLGLESLRKSIGFQFELDLNKMSQLISSNNVFKSPLSDILSYSRQLDIQDRVTHFIFQCDIVDFS